MNMQEFTKIFDSGQKFTTNQLRDIVSTYTLIDTPIRCNDEGWQEHESIIQDEATGRLFRIDWLLPIKGALPSFPLQPYEVEKVEVTTTVYQRKNVKQSK